MNNHRKLNHQLYGLFCRKVNAGHISANFSNLTNNPLNYSGVEDNQVFPLYLLVLNMSKSGIMFQLAYYSAFKRRHKKPCKPFPVSFHVKSSGIIY